MKLLSAAALALLAIAPTVASATAFSVNFEKNWDYGTEVQNYYNGGTASDGTTGPNAGVSFVNVSGLSNDPSFTYYSGAPSALGTAYAFTFQPSDRAFLNVTSGVSNKLAFFYSSPTAIAGAIQAYSGLNGTGTLLGSIDLAANVFDGLGIADVWSLATLGFGGIARSFDFTASANVVGFDNIATVPEPSTMLALLLGGTVLAATRGRKKRG